MNARSFIACTFIAMCGKSAIQKIKAAHESENTSKLAALYVRFEGFTEGQSLPNRGTVPLKTPN